MPEAATTTSILGPQQEREQEPIVVGPQKRLYHIIEGNNGCIAVCGIQPILSSAPLGVYILDSGNAFICYASLIDAAGNVVVFASKDATDKERRRGLTIAQSICADEAGGGVSLFTIDDTTDDAISRQFWKEVGVKYRSSVRRPPMSLKRADIVQVSILCMAVFHLLQDYFMITKLFRFAEGAGGRMEINLVAAGIQPDKKMLDSSASFVLDCSWCVFVWVCTAFASMTIIFGRQGRTHLERKKAGQF